MSYYAVTLPGTPGSDNITGSIVDDLLNAGGLGGQDTIVGDDGADTIFADGGDSVHGDYTPQLFGDPELGGDDLIIVTGQNNIIDGWTGSDTVEMGGGNNTVFAYDGNDLIVLNGGGGHDIDGEIGTDTLAFGFSGEVTIDGTELRFVSGGQTFTSSVRGFESISGQDTDGNATSFAFTDGVYTVCFAAGTRIMTSIGEVPVEDLRGGDLVVTLSGRGEPLKPVLWVGRRHVPLAGNPAAAELRPVLVKAGALGSGTPRRDLLVSPDHCLFLDGALVPARLLVNGRTILSERRGAEVTYYHVELERHDVLLAEGAAAESWLDCGNRAWFENSAVACLGVSDSLDAHGTGWDAARACAPLVQGGPRLAEIRAAIEARIAPTRAPALSRVA